MICIFWSFGIIGVSLSQCEKRVPIETWKGSGGGGGLCRVSHRYIIAHDKTQPHFCHFPFSDPFDRSFNFLSAL